ncbi:hypothetical protein KVV02_007875 [Mortierella alpina]|uniref:RNA helicase n=1 Tax=Mortierella alpina TaxID=64518 RepID=A0A9P7ZYY8_MORAP|nr:hypothetical protein KVV02_007875 [Mortierella alpina]
MDSYITEKWGHRDGPAPDDNQDTNWGWASEKPVYEWDEDFTDDNAPAIPELETELFGDDYRISTGEHFEEFEKIKVSVKGGPEEHRPMDSFKDVPLHPTIIENIERMEYSKPTPVQKNAIPLILGGYDLLACAQTGSGKTAAFLLPILSKILAKLARLPATQANRPGARRTAPAPYALIIVPTRELGIQIFDDTRRFTYKTRVRPVVIYGGAEMRQQKEQLARGCEILISTPGRLMDALERKAVSLDHVKFLVLDEADRTLDLGFEPAIRRILSMSNLTRDESLMTMMFSATFPTAIQVLARDFMKDDYCKLRIGRIGGTTTDIQQKLLYVEECDKEETLVELLTSLPPSRTLIFVHTKRQADYLDYVLYNQQFPCVSLHGDRNQKERELALDAFKRGISPILIATAVAARGLDIKNILHVINYDLCDDIDEYVHRIGRTGRAGHQGLATSFYNKTAYAIAPDLTKLLIECHQEMPDFLSEFIPEDELTTYENDFLDEDALAEMDALALEDQGTSNDYLYQSDADFSNQASTGWN